MGGGGGGGRPEEDEEEEEETVGPPEEGGAPPAIGERPNPSPDSETSTMETGHTQHLLSDRIETGWVGIRIRITTRPVIKLRLYWAPSLV